MHQLENWKWGENWIWVRFWLEGGALRARFPWFFAVAQYKELCVKESFRDGGGCREWHVEAMRNLDD